MTTVICIATLSVPAEASVAAATDAVAPGTTNDWIVEVLEALELNSIETDRCLAVHNPLPRCVP